MTIHLSPEVEAQLKELAVQAGQSPDELVHDLISDQFAYRHSFIQRIEEGLASLDRGEYVTHEEVEARLAPYLNPDAAPLVA